MKSEYPLKHQYPSEKDRKSVKMYTDDYEYLRAEFKKTDRSMIDILSEMVYKYRNSNTIKSSNKNRIIYIIKSNQKLITFDCIDKVKKYVEKNYNSLSDDYTVEIHDIEKGLLIATIYDIFNFNFTSNQLPY